MQVFADTILGVSQMEAAYSALCILLNKKIFNFTSYQKIMIKKLILSIFLFPDFSQSKHQISNTELDVSRLLKEFRSISSSRESLIRVFEKIYSENREET